MKRLALVALMAIGLAAVPLLAQGPGPQGHGRGMGMGPGGMGPGGVGPLGPVLHELNLTDTQREQIHALIQDNRPADGPRMTELQQKLHAALINGDTTALEQLKTELNAAHAAQLDAHIALMQKVVQILTPEQKQQLLKAQPPQRRGR